ncbi:MAG TPA: T9SS type A sorting domain-containing protein [Parafilimonas sp.]|nr:T9SS type A sorting domain-containing protein [Parafilimonas sp.]
MKTLKILLTLILTLFAIKMYAAESEPNNTKAQANTLALNGNNTGAINISGDEDWWKVTTNADGELKVNFTISNGLYMYCYIYDNNGTTELSSGYSSGNGVISKDGLANGTYYIKVRAYYSGQLPAYTLSNQLITPAQANDTEPNDSKAQAKVLPLNNSKTGHSGYYYNIKRDSADWWKVTTNADGRLRITMSSANGQYIYAHLYDNNGVTLIDQGYTSGTGAVINADGLAAGTYYVKVRMYYNTGFAPYTISDSLFKPAQANDAEPNNAKTQAIPLPLNGSGTGHVGYFYNNNRDSADWYKIITNKDGSLRLTLASGNGQYIYVYLFDKDGSILLDKGYTSGTGAVVHVDGLAAGTYYARVNCYYNNGFVPYTISDSLFAYSNANDAEPNKYPYQAKTILANKTTEGHVGFYYDNARDSVDWWKINYTGKGPLSFTINQQALNLGGYNYLYFQVYKDTTKSPIHSSYSTAASRDVNLTSLTKGYYWIRIFTYYNNRFSSYSFSNTFKQSKAKITTNTYTATPACGGASITYKLAKSNPPYTVTLYRFGQQYAQKTVNNKTAVFDNLPDGVYNASVYGDGATGSANGLSDTISILPPAPAGLNTTGIKAKQAKLNWKAVSCAAYYTIRYKAQSAGSWKTVNVPGTKTSLIIKQLQPSTGYQWNIAAADSANGMSVISSYSATATFTTKAEAFIAENDNDDNPENISIKGKLPVTTLSVAPNPASNFFVIRFNNSIKDKLTASLFNASGKAVWTSGLITAEALNGKQVKVNQFAEGLYYLKVINANGIMIGSVKIVVAR